VGPRVDVDKVERGTFLPVLGLKLRTPGRFTDFAVPAFVGLTDAAMSSSSDLLVRSKPSLRLNFGMLFIYIYIYNKIFPAGDQSAAVLPRTTHTKKIA
jgi:hypothetical protein